MQLLLTQIVSNLLGLRYLIGARPQFDRHSKIVLNNLISNKN